MPDIADDAYVIEEEHRNNALARVQRNLSSPVNETGECVTCGELIDPRRLAVMPNAVQCIHCASGANYD